MSEEYNDDEFSEEGGEEPFPEIDPVEAVRASEELLGYGADDDLHKSPEEIAAEQAMLAELEAMEADDEDVDPRTPVKVYEPPPVTEFGGIQTQNLDLLMDVSLQITVELGRRDMLFAEVLRLGKGSLVELNKIADEPVDIYVNRSKIAEGEVVVVDDHFGVRITKLLKDNSLKRL